MNYEEFLQKTSYSKEELLGMACGSLHEDFPQDIGVLPAPPMLMFDRITALSRDESSRFISAEQDIQLDDWFFQCHFRKDPVQPGCLGVDAIWQLLGFYCVASGALGAGRALGCKEVAFSGQIRPHNKLVTYEVNVRRFQRIPKQGTAIIIGSGKVLVDGEAIYEIQDAKVGTFRDIRYSNYPFKGPNCIGGTL